MRTIDEIREEVAIHRKRVEVGNPFPSQAQLLLNMNELLLHILEELKHQRREGEGGEAHG